MERIKMHTKNSFIDISKINVFGWNGGESFINIMNYYTPCSA